MNYEFANIEAKWHKYWEENDTFHTDVWDFSKPKYYVLDTEPTIRKAFLIVRGVTL